MELYSQIDILYKGANYMVFYVIGNGFDLHYGLDTRYSSFKEYLLDKDWELVEKVDELFEDYMMADNPDDIELWNTFEDMLRVFCLLDGDSIYDTAIDNAEFDDDCAGYFDSPSFNADYYTEYISTLKIEFSNWINEMDSNISKDRYFDPDNDDYILTFNYTKTIENNFDVDEANILHIHGKVGGDIIVGHNDYREPDLLDIQWDEDSDYRDISTREAVNGVLEEAAQLYFKDSKSLLERNKMFFKHIDECEKVVFLGLSCGKQDNLYVEEIAKHAHKVDFYYYDESYKKIFQRTCDKVNPNIEVNYLKW